MTKKPFATPTGRNCQPILDVLRNEFRHASSVIEIGSGNGQHAVAFAAELDHLVWQTSDLDENHEGIRAWLTDVALPNLREPLSLDVRTAALGGTVYDAAFSANTAHIMSFAAVEQMFALVADALRISGVFCLYGPFRQGGEFNTCSNAEFHKSLRSQDAAMGIRHLEDLDHFAATGGMRRERLYAMPAKNLIVVGQKSGEGENDDA